MNKFDYGRPAELFSVTSIGRQRRMGFRRFETAARAVAYAMEELDPKALAGAALEIDDERLDHQAMRRLYNHPDYPLSRKKTAA